jgi:hypothetical protein
MDLLDRESFNLDRTDFLAMVITNDWDDVQLVNTFDSMLRESHMIYRFFEGVSNAYHYVKNNFKKGRKRFNSQWEDVKDISRQEIFNLALLSVKDMVPNSMIKGLQDSIKVNNKYEFAFPPSKRLNRFAADMEVIDKYIEEVGVVKFGYSLESVFMNTISRSTEVAAFDEILMPVKNNDVEVDEEEFKTLMISKDLPSLASKAIKSGSSITFKLPVNVVHQEYDVIPKVSTDGPYVHQRDDIKLGQVMVQYRRVDNIKIDATAPEFTMWRTPPFGVSDHHFIPIELRSVVKSWIKKHKVETGLLKVLYSFDFILKPFVNS